MVNHQNLAPCPSWLFSSPSFPHRSAPTIPPPHPPAPSPTSLPNQASSCFSWAVGAVVVGVVGYVELSATAQCGEAWTCSSSRAGTRLEKDASKTAHWDARKHA